MIAPREKERVEIEGAKNCRLDGSWGAGIWEANANERSLAPKNRGQWGWRNGEDPQRAGSSHYRPWD